MGDFPTISIIGVAVIFLPILYFFLTSQRGWKIYTLIAAGMFILSLLGYNLTNGSASQPIFEAFALISMLACLGVGFMWFYDWSQTTLITSFKKFGH